jgi:hypothetical protein
MFLTSYILSERFGIELRAELLGLKARGKSKPVWIIGAWNLDIVCYLLFGAWNFSILRYFSVHYAF